jgi:endonuclease/exonuclease/phosphatase family metal-dependent hydrolase
MCVHLGLSENHRRRQARLLLDLVEAKVPAGEPLVIAGDFNDWKLHVHRQIMEVTGMIECLGGSARPPARTFPVWLPILRLDRVYLRKAVLEKASVLHQQPWTRLSDHAPLLVEIAL